MKNVLCGADIISGGHPALDGRRLGLVTTVTGVTKALTPTIDILRGHYTLAAMFSPEHGVRGDRMAGERVDDYTDAATGLPVYSLYGSTRRPSADMLADIDALVFDIQDVGCRYYTYISTMLNAMKACAELGREMVVFDRPNPIGGIAVEGNIPGDGLLSFVGPAHTPQRHGMTVAELALMFNAKYGIGCALSVVPMKGWRRDMHYDDTGLLWISPSPNIPGLDCALLYPGTCLFEGTNMSEGRGTTKPFEIIGAPWLDAGMFAAELNRLRLPGVLFRPVHFTPTASKHKNELCGGVQAHITDRAALQPVSTGLHMLDTAQKLSGARLEWVTGEGGYFIDLLAGTSELRLGCPAGELQLRWAADAAAFGRERSEYLLY